MLVIYDFSDRDNEKMADSCTLGTDWAAQGNRTLTGHNFNLENGRGWLTPRKKCLLKQNANKIK